MARQSAPARSPVSERSASRYNERMRMVLLVLGLAVTLILAVKTLKASLPHPAAPGAARATAGSPPEGPVTAGQALEAAQGAAAQAAERAKALDERDESATP